MLRLRGDIGIGLDGFDMLALDVQYLQNGICKPYFNSTLLGISMKDTGDGQGEGERYYEAVSEDSGTC